MRYFLIAGEASGDLHGSNLMRALVQKDPQAEFVFWGGDKLAEVAGHPRRTHIQSMAFMGFAGVVMNLRTIAGLMRRCKEEVARNKPDVLILIDYPGFNMRMAEFAQSQHIKVVYYISPQVWAWKKGRARKLKATVQRMLTILPFEKDFYKGYNWDVDYVCHPLLDAIDRRPEVDPIGRKKAWGLDPDQKIIALLPGSRRQEIETMLPVMVKAVAPLEGYTFVVAGAPSQDDELYERLMPKKGFVLLKNETYNLLEVAEAALVTSGTATLETALFGVPQVVCYKGNPVSYRIARMLVDIPYISLVNLILNKPVVKELIQGEFNEKQVRRELEHILGVGRSPMLQAYVELAEVLGGAGASARAAERILQTIEA